MAEYPHCSTTTIHAPGDCFYCDQHPKLQEGRKVSGEPFSPLMANGWSGNVAVKAGELHSHLGATYVVGDKIDAQSYWEKSVRRRIWDALRGRL